MKVAFYKAGSHKYMDSSLDISEAIELFTSDFALEHTEFIRTKWADQIRDQWKGWDKTPYQRYKEANLSSILFSGPFNRSDDIHNTTGLVVLDIDTATEEKIKRLKNNIPPWILFMGNSVSGFPSIFAVAKTWATTADQHKMAANGVKLYFESQFNIHVTTPDIKRIRYISYDPKAYVNLLCETFSEETAKRFINKENARAEAQEAIADEILSSNWKEFCHEYAIAKGFSPKEGERHLFVNAFSIAANLLGIPEGECLNAIEKDYNIQIGSNAVEYPYETYADVFGKWIWRLKENERERDKVILAPTEYISDKNIDLKNAIIQAPTGTGKTFAAVKIAEKLIISVPYYSLCENIASSYNLTAYHGTEKPEEKADKIVTTYASLQNLVMWLDDDISEYGLIIDEAHNLSLSASRGFMYKQLNYIIHLIEKGSFQFYTLLSGTWLTCPHYLIQKMKMIHFEKERPQKKLFQVETDNILGGISALAKKSIENGRFPFILQNDKNMARLSLVQSMAEYNFLSFSSESKEEEEFQKIIKESFIPDGVQGMVTTTVLKEGNNINNNYAIDIIIAGSYHSSEIEQVSQRFRRPKDIQIYILRNENFTRSTLSVPSQQYSYLNIQDAKKIIQSLKYVNIGVLGESFRMQISKFPVKINNDIMEIDYLICANEALISERENEYRNPTFQNRNLSKYGIIFQKTISMKNEKIKKSTPFAASALKRIDKDAFIETLNSLKLAYDPIQEAKSQERMDGYKKIQGEKSALKYFLMLVKYCSPDTAISLMELTGPSQSALMDLRRRVIFHFVEKNNKGAEGQFIRNLKTINLEWDNLEELKSRTIKIADSFGIHSDKISGYDELKMKSFRNALFKEVDGRMEGHEISEESINKADRMEIQKIFNGLFKRLRK